MARTFLFSILGLFTMLALVAAVQALGRTPVLLPAMLYDSGGSTPNALAIDRSLDVLLGNGDGTLRQSNPATRETFSICGLQL